MWRLHLGGQGDYWRKLTRELLRSVRGDLTQQEVNERLGLRFNQVYRWESGSKRILWCEFVEYCEVCKAPLRRACEQVFSYFDTLKRGDRLLRHLLPESRIATLSKQFGISRQIISRWRSGHTEVTLEGILQATELMSPSVVPFISNLVAIKTIPTLESLARGETAQRELCYEHPAVIPLIVALHLDDVINAKTHSAKFIASKVPAEPGYVEYLLTRACEVGFVRKNKGRYEIDSFAFRVSADPTRGRLYTRYHFERALQAISQPEADDGKNSFNARVFASNAEIDRKIGEALANLIAVVRDAMVSTEEPKDRVRILQIALFSPVDLPNTGSR